MLAGQPIIILKDNVERNYGREAQRSNITAAKAIAGAVRSTLGPRGMDKMLVGSTGDIVITNDGATILEEISVQHPGAGPTASHGRFVQHPGAGPTADDHHFALHPGAGLTAECHHFALHPWSATAGHGGEFLSITGATSPGGWRVA